MQPVLSAWFVGLSLVGGLCFLTALQAQGIDSDGTLKTIVTHTDGRNFTITNGSAADQNLFHSFRDFSIPTGGSATFDLSNAPNIRTIFNRVTGNTVSNVDGLIQTANATHPVTVFLLNPNGILFGANAQLNLSGSFIAATANRLQFSDGTQFDTQINPVQPPLLTISAPIGLQFGHTASIALRGTGHQLTTTNPVFAPYQPTQRHAGLAVPLNQTIALIGGNLTLDGGVLTAPEGRIELGGVNQGMVGLTAIPQGYALNYDRVSEFGAVHLSNRSLVDVNAGAIQAYGRNITLQDGSALWVQNRGVQTAGDIQVTASQSLTLIGANPNFTIRSAIVNETVSSGANGNIYINAPQLSVQSGGAIFARNYGSLIGGNLNVNARQLEVVGYPAIVPDLFSVMGAFSFGTGNAGNVNLSVQQLSVRDGAYLGSTTLGIGRSGTMTVNADTVEVRGITSSRVPSSLAVGSIGLGGDAGDLVLNTRRLTLRDSGTVASSSVGIGSAGNTTVNASEFIDIEGGIAGLYASAIASSVDVAVPSQQRIFGLPAIPQGNAGNVTINTPALRIGKGGAITVFNAGIGNAGTLRVNAQQVLLEQRAGLTALTSQGNGGNIAVAAQVLKLRQGSSITATALNRGDGGNIQLNAPVILGLENSDIVANAIDGRGGKINITTQAILGLQNRDRLTSESDITASSDLGINGTVQVSTPEVNLNLGLIELPNRLIDANQRIAEGCTSSQNNRFVITGRGGMPENPLEQIHQNRVWADLRDFQVDRKVAGIPPDPSPLIEATTWFRNAKGEVVLSMGHFVQPSIVNCAIDN